MTASIDIRDGTLVIEVHGADRIWALKSELRIPVEHVVDVESGEDEARHWLHGARAPGTNIPGVITAGTFYNHGQRVFWDVRDAANAIAILLRDELYQRLVVEVEDPQATMAAIRAALPAT